MRKLDVILICIIIALVSGIIGFIIGMNVRNNITDIPQTSEIVENTVDNESIEDTLVGTYKTNTWNGGEAVLVLNADKTMIYPTGHTGIWLFEDEKLYVAFDETNTESRIELTVVPNGIKINTHFFEKLK